HRQNARSYRGCLQLCEYTMKILFLSPYIPFPTNRGAKLRTASLIYALRNHHTVMLALNQGGYSDESEVQKYINEPVSIPHTNPIPASKFKKVVYHLWSLITLTPTPVLSERNGLMANKIHSLITEGSFDYILVEFPWLMPYAAKYKGKAKIILDC